MAADPNAPTAHTKDFPAHKRSYDRFLDILKYSVVLIAIIAAVVLYIIAN